MSTWTHVVGNIRVDGIDCSDSAIEEIKNILGKPSLYEDWFDETTLPLGSEGSVQYKIEKYGDGLPWLSISVFGDLRDFDDGSIIEKWFKETLEKLWVRDAVLMYQTEGLEHVVLTHHDFSMHDN